MRRVLPAVALVAIILLVVVVSYRLVQQPSAAVSAGDQAPQTVQLKGEVIRVSVADTPEARERGLSGRAGLAMDEGMLFVFPQDGDHAFWMKDMRFSIDILWLAADPSTDSRQAEVVYMAQNVSPDSFPQTFRSHTPARYVLELPAGYAKAHKVSIGDIVRL